MRTPLALARAINCAAAPATGRVRPMPNRPSTIKAPIAAFGPVGAERAAGIAPRLMRGCCVGRQLPGIAVEHHGDLEEPALEPARDDQRVAAVVARTGEDEHARRPPGEGFARGASRCKPGPLHQRRAGRGAFDRAQVRDATDRGAFHAPIIGHVACHPGAPASRGVDIPGGSRYTSVTHRDGEDA